MKCSEAREMIQEYLEDSLAGKELRDFEAHLKQCQECRLELQNIRSMDARLKQEIPALWNNIEPSPAFLNRLNNMEYEPTKPSVWSFFDPILTLFSDHRPAIAAGLTVLIAIILAITILPGITDENGGGDEIIAEAPAATPNDDGFFDLTERSFEADAAFNDMQLKGTSTAEIETPMPEIDHDTDFKSLFGGLAATSPPMTVLKPGSFPPDDYGQTYSSKALVTICGSSMYRDEAIEEDSYNNQQQLIEIALTDEAVKEVLGNDLAYCAKVVKEVELEAYVCSGSTVAIAMDQMIPFDPFVYVCVNSSSHMVIHYMIVP